MEMDGRTYGIHENDGVNSVRSLIKRKRKRQGWYAAVESLNPNCLCHKRVESEMFIFRGVDSIKFADKPRRQASYRVDRMGPPAMCRLPWLRSYFRADVH